MTNCLCAHAGAHSPVKIKKQGGKFNEKLHGHLTSSTHTGSGFQGRTAVPARTTRDTYD